MKAVIPSPQIYYLFRENYKINILQNYIGTYHWQLISLVYSRINVK